MTAANFPAEEADELVFEGGFVDDRALALHDVIEALLIVESTKLYVPPATPANARAYDCTHCDRRAVALGLCNVHYLRQRKGATMDAPMRNRKHGTACGDCDAPLDGKGGWGLCTKHYRSRRASIIKSGLIGALGGACVSCTGVFHPAVFDFHHLGDGKEENISEMIFGGASLMAICVEVAKCILLCANCHRIEHYDRS